jgi:glycolate oxidase iron-sulfur subunit
MTPVPATGRQTSAAAPSEPLDLQALLRVCIHCGLCLPHCATYLATGNEAQSPRGRLLLLGEIQSGRLPAGEPGALQALDTCLDCRACGTVCPSGIQPELLGLGKSLARRHLEPRRAAPPLRLASASVLRWLRLVALAATWLLGLILGPRWRRRLEGRSDPTRRWSRLLGSMPRAARRDRDLVRLLDGLVARLPLERGPEDARRGPTDGSGPAVAPAAAAGLAMVAGGVAGDETIAAGRKAGPLVGLFRGCASQGLLPGASERLRQLLELGGCRVVPAGQACCGAFDRHAGRIQQADELRDRNMAALSAPGTRMEFLVVEAAGCGLELRNYGPPVGGSVVDAVALLDRLAPMPRRRVGLRVVIHDPCHARHGQGVVEEPRRLLGRIPGLVIVPTPEAEVCCGSGGPYAFEHPELSSAMGRRKARRLADTGADLIVTSNPGCLGQILDGLALEGMDLPVVPLTDLLWYACRPAGPTRGG